MPPTHVLGYVRVSESVGLELRSLDCPYGVGKMEKDGDKSGVLVPFNACIPTTCSVTAGNGTARDVHSKLTLRRVLRRFLLLFICRDSKPRPFQLWMDRPVPRWRHGDVLITDDILSHVSLSSILNLIVSQLFCHIQGGGSTTSMVEYVRVNRLRITLDGSNPDPIEHQPVCPAFLGPLQHPIRASSVGKKG